tara:strand:- start:144 stop:413 length:270 start_codon:yes stop_codon:yes gene_type:complete
MIKKFVVISTIYTLISFSTVYAEKVECDLLSPIQKFIYCKSIAKKETKQNKSIESQNKTIVKTKSFLKKVTSKLNTKSTLGDKLKGLGK